MRWSAALLLVMVGDAAAEAPLILDTAEYGGKQLPAPLPMTGWLALCPAPSGFELRKTSLRLRPFQDLIAGDEGAQRSGRRVTATGCPHPRALFRGHPFHAGPLVSGRVENDTTAVLGDTRVTLEQTPCKDQVLSKEYLRVGNSRLFLFDYEAAECGSSRIRWAGDADGDGQLDLLVEQDDEWIALRLFLSSQGKSKDRWEAALETHHGGC